ncbi:hypothetical protein Tco_0166856, partial [Tanacetum coccineum]
MASLTLSQAALHL